MLWAAKTSLVTNDLLHIRHTNLSGLVILFTSAMQIFYVMKLFKLIRSYYLIKLQESRIVKTIL